MNYYSTIRCYIKGMINYIVKNPPVKEDEDSKEIISIYNLLTNLF